MKKGLVAAILVLMSATSSFATLIDFSADGAGSKSNGFSSVAAPGVQFYDTIGANLQVGDYGHQSIGNGLAVYGDDTSQLKMVFDSAASFLSLDFGNDDQFWNVTNAILELYQGTALVGQSNVVVNHNDLMDQSISFTGAFFDSAVFYYANATGAPTDLIEVVDNINYEPVPEPSTFLLLGAGIAGMALVRRRVRKA